METNEQQNKPQTPKPNTDVDLPLVDSGHQSRDVIIGNSSKKTQVKGAKKVVIPSRSNQNKVQKALVTNNDYRNRCHSAKGLSNAAVLQIYNPLIPDPEER